MMVLLKNKEERYSLVPRLSDTRYSVRNQSSKARLKLQLLARY